VKRGRFHGKNKTGDDGDGVAKHVRRAQRAVPLRSQGDPRDDMIVSAEPDVLHKTREILRSAQDDDPNRIVNCFQTGWRIESSGERARKFSARRICQCKKGIECGQSFNG
jgi:hypothetical protein